MKIFPVCHPTEPASIRHHRNFLEAAALYQGSDPALADSAETAGAILLFDPADDPLARWIRHHPLVKTYPEKCFSYSELDQPYCYLPGIHVSASRPPVLAERVQTYAYISYGPGEPLRNRYVSAYAAQELPKRYLFSFVGRLTHRCRRRLRQADFQRPDVYVETPDYNHWGGTGSTHDAQQRAYAEIAKQSCFAICPRGVGLNSIRLYEMMELGVAPVILADGWMLPEGPDWRAFAVFLPEDKVGQLPQLLEPLQDQAEAMGRRARLEWETWFAPEHQFVRMAEILETIRTRRRFPEALARKCWTLALLRHRGRLAKVRLAVLLHHLHLKRIR